MSKRFNSLEELLSLRPKSVSNSSTDAKPQNPNLSKPVYCGECNSVKRDTKFKRVKNSNFGWEEDKK